MDSDEKYLYLLEDVQAKIALLEKAVDEVGLVKKTLKTTAADVKVQIRDSISRHLEALRNRETWLLSQVEVLQHGKEDLLRLQHAELNQAVGSLRSTLSLLQQKGSKLAEVEHLEEQLINTIQAVEKLNLVPVESSNIRFKALNLEFLDQIRKFGIVVADDMLESSFDNMSLDDKVPDSGMKRKLFAPSGPTGEWLLRDGSFHRSFSMPGALNSSNVDHSAIENWLARCHISDAKSPQFGTETWLLAPSSLKAGNTAPEAIFGYIQELKSSALDLWLKRVSPGVPLKPSVITETYVKIAALGSEHWLAYKQRRSVQRSITDALKELQELYSANPGMWLKRGTEQAPAEAPTAIGEAYDKIAATAPEMWLRKETVERPEAMVSLPSKTYDKIAASSNDNWLRPKPNCNKTVACSDCECWSGSSISAISDNDSTMSADDDSFSDGDWLSIKKEDFISIENLDSLFQLRRNNPPSSKQTWLQEKTPSPAAGIGDQCGIKAYNEMLQAVPKSTWLMSTPSPTSPMQQAESGLTQHLQSQPMDKNQWLIRPKPRPDICQWLARSSVERCKECPPSCSKDLFRVFRSKDESALDSWLLKSTKA